VISRNLALGGADVLTPLKLKLLGQLTLTTRVNFKNDFFEASLEENSRLSFLLGEHIFACVCPRKRQKSDTNCYHLPGLNQSKCLRVSKYLGGPSSFFYLQLKTI